MADVTAAKMVVTTAVMRVGSRAGRSAVEMVPWSAEKTEPSLAVQSVASTAYQ